MRTGNLCGRAMLASLVALSINAWSAEPDSEQDLCDPALAAPVPDSELQTQRGQADVRWVTLSDVDVDGNVDGNQTVASPTGDNAIADSALHDAHGFTTVIQNTGNHVVIQDVTIINVTID